MFFHREYPDVKISGSTLYRLYSKHGIKFKKRQTKAHHTEAKKISLTDDQINQVTEALRLRDKGKLILYLDETNFMAKKHLPNAYSSKYTSQTHEKEGIRAKTMSAVVVISSEHGLVEHQIEAGAFNADLFLDFLDKLRFRLGNRRDIVIFMDNL